MSGSPCRRGIRRLSPQSCKLAIVLAVPLAATCLLVTPTAPPVAQTRANPTPVEHVASMPERQRRAAEQVSLDGSPHDPPRHVHPYRGEGPGDHHPTAMSTAAPAVRRPELAATSFHPSAIFVVQSNVRAAVPARAPPPAGDIRC
ncbi:MAG: hypothetical protein KF858_15260 [Candidatus Sumerlaeia bacterium]|nr:hypothetical protein [Candidatus Sumerlaeia bacterium]